MTRKSIERFPKGGVRPKSNFDEVVLSLTLGETIAEVRPKLGSPERIIETWEGHNERVTGLRYGGWRNGFKKPGRRCASACLVALCAFAVPVSSAGAIGGPTVTFQELDKGATFHFVDNPPEAALGQGAVLFSPGDMLISTNPLAMEGKVVGKIRIVCTATSAGGSKHPARAGFNCTGIAKIPGGSLVLVAELSEGPTEGAVTGGTGIYAGAKGTFVSRRERHSATTTVTLLE